MPIGHPRMSSRPPDAFSRAELLDGDVVTVRRLIPSDAEVSTENHAMLRVMADAGWPCAWERDGSVFHVNVDLDEIGDPK